MFSKCRKIFCKDFLSFLTFTVFLIVRVLCVWNQMLIGVSSFHFSGQIALYMVERLLIFIIIEVKDYQLL